MTICLPHGLAFLLHLFFPENLFEHDWTGIFFLTNIKENFRNFSLESRIDHFYLYPDLNPKNQPRILLPANGASPSAPGRQVILQSQFLKGHQGQLGSSNWPHPWSPGPVSPWTNFSMFSAPRLLYCLYKIEGLMLVCVWWGKRRGGRHQGPLRQDQKWPSIVMLFELSLSWGEVS
jgi:hypothetical protein